MTDGISVQRLLRERVAEEVRALLARKMMTGADLAAAIGRSPMYVSRRIRGEVAFDLDDIERLADVLGVEVGDLLPRAVGAGAGSAPELKKNLAVPHLPARNVTERSPSHHHVAPTRHDSVRPDSSVPATRRRPVAMRPPNKPMVA